jgi:vancomycin permeability regulator SanA
MMTGKTMGESGKIEAAKKVIWNVMIGLVIMLAAWLIVDSLIGALTTNKTWATICPKRI